MKHTLPERTDYERIARELVRALRGQRTRAELSRRAGYRSNVVHRWEAGECWPSASRFLQLRAYVRKSRGSWIQAFLHKAPPWAANLDENGPEAVAAFLQHVRGKTPILRIAEIAERNRYSVSRWLDGSTEPRLPDFLRLVDACSRRLVDLIGVLEDPALIPSLRERWELQQLARKAAYDHPWSQAVLRALELEDMPTGVSAQEAYIARKLGVSHEVVRESLVVLKRLAQVTKSRNGYVPRRVMTIDTGSDPVRARDLKIAWTSTALERLRADAPGAYGWNVFAISAADMTRLNNVHLQYVRAMREIIASSSKSECVGLYCAQLLDLGAR